MSEPEAEAKVDTALNGGYITPAMLPWAMAFCRQNPQAFDGLLASGAPAWGASVPSRAEPRAAADRSARAAGRGGRDRGATGPLARRAGLTNAYRGPWFGAAAIKPEAESRFRLGRF